MLRLFKYSTLSIVIGLCLIYLFSWILTLCPKGFTTTDIFGAIGAYGSFLCGIGTIIASIAAMIALDTWQKELRISKYLNLIWDCKVALLKFHHLEMQWHIDNVLRLDNKIECKNVQKYINDLDISLKNILSIFPKFPENKKYTTLLTTLNAFKILIAQNNLFAEMQKDKSMNEKHIAIADLDTELQSAIEALQNNLDELEKEIMPVIGKKL